MLAVHCSQIGESDIADVAVLLARSFPSRTREYWRAIFAQLGEREPLPDLPKYGYFLQAERTPVGAILLISSEIFDGDCVTRRCNLSSWCIEPAYRAYAPLLVSQALSHRKVTYLNISPAPQTLPIIEAQGFSRYCDGAFTAVPILTRCFGGAKAKLFDARQKPPFGVDVREQRMLLEHARYGCISVWCMTEQDAYPFIFRQSCIRNVIPHMQLIYCRDVSLFVRFAAEIGRYFASKGCFFVTIDSNGPIAGLIGKLRRNAPPKYFKGPRTPRLGDLAYTERALLGI